MSQKVITDLQLRDEAADTLNFAVDDGIQTYRLTAAQLKAFILAEGNVERLAIESSERIPRGMIAPFAGTTAPTGWLFCDGSAVSRTTYSSLFAAISVAFGEGNGSSTFNIPDLRGRFIRGVDGAAGRDPDKTSRTAMATGGNTGNAVGSVQGDETRSHTHTQNAHSHNINTTNGTTTSTVQAANLNTSNRVSRGLNFGYSNATDTSAVVSSTATNQNTGGNETRPINASTNFIIKF